MADILGAEVDEEGFLVDLKDWTKEKTLPCAARSASIDEFALFAAEITPSSINKITLVSSIVFKQDCNEWFESRRPYAFSLGR
jgi:hypothetical protein